jgi:hypothetical protein
MPKLQSNKDLPRVHRWSWPSVTAVAFWGAPLLVTGGFFLGAHIVPAALIGERPALPHDRTQSITKETAAVEVMPPFEGKENLQLAAAKAKLAEMVEASSAAPSSPAPTDSSNISMIGTTHPSEVAAIDFHKPTDGTATSPTERVVPLPPPRTHLSAAFVSRAVPLPPHRAVESAPPPDVMLPDRHAVQ